MKTTKTLVTLIGLGACLAACDSTQDLGGGTTEGGANGEGGSGASQPSSGPTTSATGNPTSTGASTSTGDTTSQGGGASTGPTTSSGSGSGGGGGAGGGEGGAPPVCEGPDGLALAQVLLEADEGAPAVAVDAQHVLVSTRSSGASKWSVDRFRKTDGTPRGFFPQFDAAPWALGLDDGQVYGGGIAEGATEELLFGSSPFLLPEGSPDLAFLHTYSPDSVVRAIGFGATDAVWVEGDRLWKAPKIPQAPVGPPTLLLSVGVDVQDDAYFVAVVADDTYAFVANAGWINGPGGIVRVRLDGTEVTTIATTPDYSDGSGFCIGPDSLFLDGDDVVFNDSCAGQVLRVSKDGGVIAVIAESSGGALTQVVSVGDRVFFGQFHEECGTIVRSVPKIGGVVVDEAFVGRYVSRAVSDGTDVYLVPGGGGQVLPGFQLYRVPGG